MMLATLLGLCLASLSAPDEGSYHKLFPHPTGQNGFEDYVLAGDLLTSPRAELLFNWTPHQYADMLAKLQSLKAEGKRPEPSLNKAALDFAASLANKTQLEIWQLEANEMSKALVYIQIGNMKPIEDPRQELNSETITLGLDGFIRIAQIAKQASFADCADGRFRDAITLLAASFIQTSRSSELSWLIRSLGDGCQSILFEAFDQTRLSWSLDNAKQVEALCDQFLSLPAPMRTVLQGDYAFVMSVMREALKPGYQWYRAHAGEEWYRQAGAISKLKGSQRDQFVRSCYGLVKARFDEASRHFSGDESHWIEPIEDNPPSTQSGASPQDLAVRMVADMWKPPFSHDGTTLARQRTQIRILRLHARITQYRWATGHLPKTLAEVATPAELLDPFSKSPFQYELNKTGGYRLYSKGFKGSNGEIELDYKPSFDDEPGEARP